MLLLATPHPRVAKRLVHSNGRPRLIDLVSFSTQRTVPDGTVAVERRARARRST